MKKTRDTMKLRSWCIRRRGEGVPVNQICASVQIPRRTFYNWWTRYRQRGLEGLEPQSKRPHTIHRTRAQTVDEIKAVRRKTDWCPHKIAGYLRRQGTPVGHMTVYRILCSSGLNRPSGQLGSREPTPDGSGDTATASGNATSKSSAPDGSSRSSTTTPDS